MSAFLHELQSGATRLRGTTLDGSLHIQEADINAWLASMSTAGVRIEIQANNRVVVYYGVLHATVVVPHSSSLSQAPSLTFSLASIAVAWTLKHALKQPFVRVHDRNVTVDLAAVPALHAYRLLLRRVSHVGITTTPAALAVQFTVAVE